MICHFVYDLRGYAVCGVFPTWSTTSWTSVTCPACWEKRRTDEQEWLALEILADYVPAEPDTVTDSVRVVYGEGPEEQENQEIADWLQVDEWDLGESPTETRNYFTGF